MGDPADGDRDGGLDHVFEAWEAVDSRGAEVHTYWAGEAACAKEQDAAGAGDEPGCDEVAEVFADNHLEDVGTVRPDADHFSDDHNQYGRSAK